MEPEAATPTGGAEPSARPDSASQSIPDRLKASLFPPAEKPPEKPKPQVARAEASTEQPAEEQEAEEVETPPQIDDEEAEPSKDALTQAELSTLHDLAEATGLELDRLMELDIPTKIDGKEGKARLRELIKSYQLEGHLNQKLMTHADEKKAFETERQTFLQQTQHKVMQMDAALQVANKLLQGEFAGINWQELQNTDPMEFNQRYVSFQQRQAQLNHLADLIGQERQQAQQQTAQQQQAYLQEQAKLMETKIPEWNDKAKRDKDLADMLPVVKDVYGISEEEVKNLTDHREILVLRDAWKWQQLQKSKPAMLNKVKVAPKLIKPGAPQSRAAQEGLMLKQERDKLRKTGKVSDAKAPLKRLLFN